MQLMSGLPGGRYDGILGVTAALEVLRTLHENYIQTHCPISLIDWTNEEGARFPGAMMCSGVWSTKSTTGLEACYATKDTEGISMKKALEDIGYLGDTPCDCRENGLECYFELHIEQGPKLEATGKRVGVVTGVQAMKWFAIRVSGVEGHSGTTPMDTRSDALVTASLMIAAVRDRAMSTRLGVATVGVITNDTQSQATIPSGVEFIIDIRCSTDKMVEGLCLAIFQSFDEIVQQENNSTSYRVVRTWGLPESTFHDDCIGVVRSAAVDEVGLSEIMDMKSNAGHDASVRDISLNYIFRAPIFTSREHEACPRYSPSSVF
jgi:hydantoinase/carbamoylase family amidase